MIANHYEKPAAEVRLPLRFTVLAAAPATMQTLVLK
jgi:hypothetical protein